ncbi:hypothetical protein SEA_LEOPARD_9 [Mycobacterium phage Leopard]|nr:hypothetical protein SEA_LEOPARD_9 [Mycobacterium phage Leopard]
MAWSEKARKAAALARKRNSKTKKLTRATPLMKRPKSVPPSINLAQSSRTKHKKGEATSKSGRAVYKPKKKSRKK